MKFLTGNGLETSELLSFTPFCTNTKNDLSYKYNKYNSSKKTVGTFFSISVLQIWKTFSSTKK
jgi:hypothetical protein